MSQDLLNRCFEAHSFNELSTIDYGMLQSVVKRALELSPESINGTFFDVGCNAGSFVNALKSIGISKNIYCFEPHPVLSAKVMEVHPEVNMNKICLGSYNGEIKINIPMLSCGLSSIVYRPVFDRLQQPIIQLDVPCKTIDSFCEENKIDTIDFIKIDVEGGEKHVFMGAKKMLAGNKIKAGVFEVGQTLTDAGTSGDELVNMLQFFGYKVDKGFSQCDYMFHL
jgi:FkbM family methyltransferase